jgi:hypothetical protein
MGVKGCRNPRTGDRETLGHWRRKVSFFLPLMTHRQRSRGAHVSAIGKSGRGGGVSVSFTDAADNRAKSCRARRQNGAVFNGSELPIVTPKSASRMNLLAAVLKVSD